ncbi:MAG: hypothetical protein E6G56_06130 [Actinobacteria bacterium]|nr:MAG: hypothetical protein E6G56_06130 [Actinomycetota bacterium]
MTDTLEPDRALEYLGALTPGVEAIALLDGEGNLLAGERPSARHRGGTAGTLTERAGGYGLVVQLSRPPGTTEALVRHDLRRALGLLAPSDGEATVDRR